MCFIEFNSKDEKEAAYEKKDELELDGRSVYLDVLNGGGRGGGRGGRQSFGRGGRGGGRGRDSFGRGRDSFGRGGRGGRGGSRGPCKYLTLFNRDLKSPCCCIHWWLVNFGNEQGLTPHSRFF